VEVLSLSGIRARLEALEASAAQTRARAQEAHRLAGEAQRRADHGAEVASGSIGAMDGISDSSRKIAAAIAVVDSVAAQTNLLALNAAVEAARAGEHGRGFAVVAAEIRSLAIRSAEAAKEIKQLVDASLRHVQEGEALVEASGEGLAGLTETVKQVDALVGEIAAAAEVQSSGLAELARVIGQLEARQRS
jgi:methyl-accepting chemotaxis protein